MPETARQLIEAYSGLSRSEQLKFDREHKNLLRFRGTLNKVADFISTATDEQLEAFGKKIGIPYEKK